MSYGPCSPGVPQWYYGTGERRVHTLWDPAAATQIACRRSRPGGYRSLAFHPREAILFAAGLKGPVEVLEVPSLRLLRIIGDEADSSTCTTLNGKPVGLARGSVRTRSVSASLAGCHGLHGWDSDLLFQGLEPLPVLPQPHCMFCELVVMPLDCDVDGADSAEQLIDVHQNAGKGITCPGGRDWARLLLGDPSPE